MANPKKREDGRYLKQIQIGVTDSGRPKYKAIYGKTKKEVEEKAVEFLQQMKRGVIINDENLSVGDWARQWLESYKSNSEYNTIRMYNGVLNTYILPSIGDIPLKKLKLFHVQDMINGQLAAGHHTTARQILLTIKQILKTAIKNELIYKNVADDVEMPKKMKSKKRALTEEEIGYIYTADLNLKQSAFLKTLLYTGMRKGEILALQKDDIDFQKRTVHVSKAVIIKVNQAEIKDIPKSEAGDRILPIVDALYPTLQSYVSQQKSPIVFPSASGTLMSDTSYRRFWSQILKALNLAAGGNAKQTALASDITAHIFRHTYITMLYYAGVGLKAAQYLAGHASIQMTMNVYTQLEMERDTSSLPALNQYFSGINERVIFKEEKSIDRTDIDYSI
jgi:integrase